MLICFDTYFFLNFKLFSRHSHNRQRIRKTLFHFCTENFNFIQFSPQTSFRLFPHINKRECTIKLAPNKNNNNTSTFCCLWCCASHAHYDKAGVVRNVFFCLFPPFSHTSLDLLILQQITVNFSNLCFICYKFTVW